MNPNELNIVHIAHVVGVLVLVAFTFFAFAGPAETRKRVLMITGMASLLVLATGIRMWQGLFGFHAFGWIIVKLFCWLVISGLTGAAYRKRDKANTLMVIVLVLATIAVVMVYAKPF